MSIEAILILPQLRSSPRGVETTTNSDNQLGLFFISTSPGKQEAYDGVSVICNHVRSCLGVSLYTFLMWWGTKGKIPRQQVCHEGNRFKFKKKQTLKNQNKLWSPYQETGMLFVLYKFKFPRKYFVFQFSRLVNFCAVYSFVYKLVKRVFETMYANDYVFSFFCLFFKSTIILMCILIIWIKSNVYQKAPYFDFFSILFGYPSAMLKFSR